MHFSEIRSLTGSHLGSKFSVCAGVDRRPRFGINNRPRSALRMGNSWGFDPKVRNPRPGKLGNVYEGVLRGF